MGMIFLCTHMKFDNFTIINIIGKNKLRSNMGSILTANSRAGQL